MLGRSPFTILTKIIYQENQVTLDTADAREEIRDLGVMRRGCGERGRRSRMGYTRRFRYCLSAGGINSFLRSIKFLLRLYKRYLSFSGADSGESGAGTIGYESVGFKRREDQARSGGVEELSISRDVEVQAGLRIVCHLRNCTLGGLWRRENCDCQIPVTN